MRQFYGESYEIFFGANGQNLQGLHRQDEGRLQQEM
jgi:hypothetical protein